MSELTQTANIETLPHTVRLMERLGAEQFFDTPKDAKSYLETLNYTEFSSLLNRINGLERSIPTEKRKMDGYGYVEMSGMLFGKNIEHQPPRQSDRGPLMQAAFEVAQNATTPEDAALLLGLCINAIHPYEDGNGRTSRLVYMLLQHGYNGTPSDIALYSSLLKNTGGRQIVDLNPGRVNAEWAYTRQAIELAAKETDYNGPIPTHVFDSFGDAMAGEYTPDDLMINSEISNEARDKLYKSIADNSGRFTVPAFIRLIKNKGLNPSDFIKQVESSGNTFLLGREILPILDETDIDFISETSFDDRRDYVLALTSWSLDKVKELYRPKESSEV
jgi:Fic/DOC family